MTERHCGREAGAFSRQWASLLIVARQVSCHPAETIQVVLQWHEKLPWSRDEWSITNAERELAFCVFLQGKRLANLTVLGVSPARREWHGERLNCPCGLWLLSECIYSRGLVGMAPRLDVDEVSSHLVATWLILPVVICLSLRLSHACLSTNS